MLGNETSEGKILWYGGSIFQTPKDTTQEGMPERDIEIQ